MEIYGAYGALQILPQYANEASDICHGKRGKERTEAGGVFLREVSYERKGRVRFST